MNFRTFPEIKDINDKYELINILGDKISIWIPSPLVGDTIAATPTVREIKKRYGNVKIDVYTYHPDIFSYSHHVDKAYQYDPKLEGHHFYYKLIDYGYQNTYVTHCGEIYDTIDLSISNMIDVPSYVCLDKFILPDHEKWLEICVSKKEETSMLDKIKAFDLDFNKLVIIHPSINTPTRTWPEVKWQSLTDLLLNDGFQVVAMGSCFHAKSGYKYHPGMQPCPKGVMNLIDKFSILESKCLLDRALALITMDTGIMHIGLSSNIRIVAMFTVIHPVFRKAWRNGSFNYNFIVPTPSGNCHYCSLNHRNLLLNRTLAECPLAETPLCLHSVDSVYQSFKELIKR